MSVLAGHVSKESPDPNSAALPKLPFGWISTTVGAFCNILGGGTPSTKRSEYWDGDIPWISSADIHAINDIRPRKKINKQAIDKSSTHLLPAGAIIVVTRVGLGKVAIVSEPLCFSQDSQGLVFDSNKVYSPYLIHYLSRAVQRFKYEGRGTTISGVTKRQLRELEVLLPPLPEQHRIVAEIEKQFSRLDASEAALMRAQVNLKRYRSSVLKSACEGKLVPTEAQLAREEDRDYEPADRLLDRILAERRARWSSQPKRRGNYKEPVAPDTSSLPELPEGWVWSKIGKSFEVYVGSTPRRARSDFWNGDIPWVSSGEVSYSRIKATREYITEEGLKNSSVTLHPKGTILLGMIGEGKTRGQVSILDIPACNSQNSAAIRVSESGLPQEYVFYYLWGQYDATRRIGSGNNQPALNKSRVQELLMPLPPLADQRRIVAEVERRLSIIQQVEAAVEANLKRAERLRQSVLKQAFSGKLVPQDPNDEPASLLLERIRAERAEAEAAAKRKPRRTRRGGSEPAHQSQLAVPERAQ